MQLRNMKIGIRAASVFALLGTLVLFMGLLARSRCDRKQPGPLCGPVLTELPVPK